MSPKLQTKPKAAPRPTGVIGERHGRSDDAHAFVPDPAEGGAHPPVDDADSFAEEFIAAATAGESVAEDALDEVVPEEQGGPFIQVDTAEEQAEIASLLADEPKARRPPR